mgnify:CR=1 FL=1|tara:strand:+ start:282 stop:533 length:252 start_codon:yes stop_codon:yes gene_type:complete
MANDPISNWANNAQEKESKRYEESALPKNSINTPLEPSRQELMEKLQSLTVEHKRVVNNSNEIKLQLIEEREKLNKITNILTK